MISAGDAKDARGRRVPLMNTEYLLVAYLYLRSARFSKSPRDRTGQGSKTGGIAVAVAGSGEYFSLPAQLLLPTVPPIVQRGPLNVFPFLLLAYCRLQSERADEEPFHGTAWPGLACRRPTAIHT